MSLFPLRCGLCLASIILLASCSREQEGVKTAPIKVAVIRASVHAVPLELTYMARTAGVREVEVRARVSGILLHRRYKEGARVNAGEVLFSIEATSYEMEVSRARAEAGVAAAHAAEAERQLKRLEPLVQQNVISRRAYDEAIASYESSRAQLGAAKAVLRSAELNLWYTDVRAPISGLTSREARSEGSLVRAGDESSLLTHISQTDHLNISFSMPVYEASVVREEMQRRAMVRVLVQTPDGRELPEPATLYFVDVRVDQESGTVEARATMPNPDGEWLPGQFVRVRIPDITQPDAVVMPSRGIVRSTMGATIWVVSKDGKAQLRSVQLGQSSGNYTAISKGLEAGEHVIVDGVMKVRAGAVVEQLLVDDAPTIVSAEVGKHDV